MTFLRNAADGGADGVTVTTSNSDDEGGDALSVATGTRTYSTDFAHSGSTSFKISGTSGNTAIMGLAISPGTAGVSGRMYVYFPALPSATCEIMQFRSVSPEGSRGAIQLRADGKLEVTFKTGSAVVTTAALSTATWYRLERRVIKGTGTGDGVSEFSVYAGDSETPIETVSATDIDVGTDDLGHLRWGKLTGIASTFTFYVDDVAFTDDGSELIGPLLGDPVLDYVRSSGPAIIDTTGSNGVVTLTQTSGTTVTSITGPTAEKFYITLPAVFNDDLVFELEVTGDGDPITESFTIRPTPRRLVLTKKEGEWVL